MSDVMFGLALVVGGLLVAMEAARYRVKVLRYPAVLAGLVGGQVIARSVGVSSFLVVGLTIGGLLVAGLVGEDRRVEQSKQGLPFSVTR